MKFVDQNRNINKYLILIDIMIYHGNLTVEGKKNTSRKLMFKRSLTFLNSLKLPTVQAPIFPPL
jgi:hypothetical protein